MKAKLITWLLAALLCLGVSASHLLDAQEASRASHPLLKAQP